MMGKTYSKPKRNYISMYVAFYIAHHHLNKYITYSMMMIFKDKGQG